MDGRVPRGRGFVRRILGVFGGHFGACNRLRGAGGDGFGAQKVAACEVNTRANFMQSDKFDRFSRAVQFDRTETCPVA